MKKIFLCLLVAGSLISCQDEYSYEGSKDDIYKKTPNPKLNLSELKDNNSEENKEVNTQQAPFDLGIATVLGAGALAAVRMARKHKKEQRASKESNT